MRMKQIKEEAKKRRAKLLAQLVKFDTITELAEFHGLTSARMQKIISQAKKEAALNNN